MEYRQSNNNKHYDFILSGKFTFSDHEKFRDIIEIIQSGKAKSVAMDFKDVDFIDSAALGMLLVAREEGEKASASIVLQNTENIDKMLKISKFDTLFVTKKKA